MTQNQSRPYILGLDIGVASIGWACIECDPSDNHRPLRLLAAGSHIFEPGTEGSQSDIERGKDVARNQVRRTARLMRRQIWRRARRKRLLLRLLIEHDLLPAAPSPLKRPQEIDEYLKAFDAGLRERWLKDAPHVDQLRLPYLLRAAAAERKVERHDFGRALYHLAQRRGFLSNRRADARKKDDEDKGKVKQAIGELAQRVAAHTPPLLGAYLASLDPDEQRLRGRWTSRKMYEDEFAALWEAQSGHHALTDEARAAIHKAIFHQRPLKSQKNLIGRCSLMPDQPRAPIAHRMYQRFRVLQTMNNLQIVPPDGAPRPPTAEQREKLLSTLLVGGDLTFAKARSLLKLPRGTTFNLERGEETRFVGHRTDHKLREVFGDDFDGFPEHDKDRMVEDLRSFRLPEPLERRGRRRWGLDADRAKAFAAINLEEGYAPLSLAAISRLMPDLERGVPYATARRAAFPETFAAQEPLESLPPVQDVITELRNPAVTRSLTEVRKLVNQIVRARGKPLVIRVELAREIKNPRGVREKITKQMREREKERATIAERIVREAGIPSPKRDDIERVLLADECGWHCPYTGLAFGMKELLGPTPQIDVEHIWPRSRSLDDSFLNKTLCHHEENRSRKRGRTPFEAYAGNPETWAEILKRVERFKGDPFTRLEKLRRFRAEEIDADFSNRHLSDTRYIGRAAADYLGLLYGGRDDASGTKRVQVCTGGLTAWLRSGWGIADLLGDDGEKSRADHRHHAVDAVVVALSDPRAVQLLSSAAAVADQRWSRRAFDHVDPPWPGFREQVADVIDRIIVSHRQSRRVSGPLHNDTIYSKPIDGRPRVRKELFKLSPSEIRDGRIVDKRALKAIRDKLAELGRPDPTPRDIGQLFGDPANLPLVRGHNGRLVKLRKVRVLADPGQVQIGRADAARQVSTANNHHTVIYAELDAAGREVRWADEPVSLFEAYRRHAAGLPIVQRDVGQGRRFICSLAPGEYVEMDTPDDATKRAVYRVLSISHRDMELRLHHDARTADEVKKAKARIRVSGDRLRRLRARKVGVSYLGEVRNAGG